MTTDLAAMLKPFDTLLTPQAFADGLRAFVALPGETDDPAEFWRDLMVSVEYHCLSTTHWKSFFLEGSTGTAMDYSPRTAIVTLLDTLSRSVRVDAESARLLAEAYLKLGQLPASEYCASVAFRLGDRSSAVLGLLVGLMLRENAHAQARELVALARELHPAEPETLFGEAQLLLAEPDGGKELEGLSRLETLVSAFPGYLPAWDRLMKTLIRRQEWDRAAQTGKNAPATLRAAPYFLKKLAAVELRRESPEKAAELLDEALAALRQQGTAPPREVALFQLDRAEVALHRRKTAQAAEAALASLSPLEGDADALARALDLLRQAGAFKEEARKALAQERKNFPDHEGLALLQGRLDFEEGRDQEAFDLLQSLAEKNPNNTEALFLMALLCLRNRQYAAAAELALVIPPLDAQRATQAWLIAADALHRMGKSAEALQVLGEAGKSIPPGHPAAEEIRLRRERLENILKIS